MDAVQNFRIYKTRHFFIVLLSVSALLAFMVTQPTWADSEPKPVAAVAQEPVVNINRATAAELAEALKGVGEGRAQAIVDYRAENGDFKSIEQLMDVTGIGESTFNANRQRLKL